MDSGSRKVALASLLVGGAVSSGEFGWAFAAFAVYVAANVVMKVLSR